ncbi:MAG: ABC transporter permease subunit, partial [Mesorhizobium sp.]
DYTRAAYSLGASGPRTFYKVYLPLVWPGIWSGCLLSYVIVVGYYITPLLVGGSQDQMLSYFIAFYTKQTVNWGLASALAILLTTCVLVLVGLYGLLGRKSQIVVKA